MAASPASPNRIPVTHSDTLTFFIHLKFLVVTNLSKFQIFHQKRRTTYTMPDSSAICNIFFNLFPLFGEIKIGKQGNEYHNNLKNSNKKT